MPKLAIERNPEPFKIWITKGLIAAIFTLHVLHAFSAIKQLTTQGNNRDKDYLPDENVFILNLKFALGICAAIINIRLLKTINAVSAQVQPRQTRSLLFLSAIEGYWDNLISLKRRKQSQENSSSIRAAFDTDNRISINGNNQVQQYRLYIEAERGIKLEKAALRLLKDETPMLPLDSANSQMVIYRC